VITDVKSLADVKPGDDVTKSVPYCIRLTKETSYKSFMDEFVP
jgi:hypothetical protein